MFKCYDLFEGAIAKVKRCRQDIVNDICGEVGMPKRGVNVLGEDYWSLDKKEDLEELLIYIKELKKVG